jgi:hypothetical protein
MTKAQTHKASPRRRPGRDPVEAAAQEKTDIKESQKEKIMEQNTQNTQGTQNQQVPPPQAPPQTEKSWDDVEAEAAGFEKEQSDVYHLEFYGSELVRLKAPKLMEVAEKVAFDWVNDKDFENIQVGHPVAQIALAQGLKTAKKVEKKLEEKGVIALAKMGVEFAKSKLKK